MPCKGDLHIGWLRARLPVISDDGVTGPAENEL
jgi:hypothetical protein